MIELLQYPFFRQALLAALMTSVICGIVGTYITSKRIVFISGGISHASFGGIGIGHYLANTRGFGLDPIFSALIFSVLSALGMKFLSDKSRVREDSAIGMLWSLGMAVGILFLYVTPGYAPDLMSYLFGSILAVSKVDIVLLAVVMSVAIVTFIVWYRPILYTTFDEAYAKIIGLPVCIITNLLMVLVALAIVVNIRVVGIILVMSLLTVPQATASELVKDFRSIILLSILFALLASIGGLLLSYYLNIPSGATIVILSTLIFGIVKLYKELSLQFNNL